MKLINKPLQATIFDHGEDNEDAFSAESLKLKSTASTKEIFDLFTHPLFGITYLALAPTLPSCVFTSWDAINWINSHVEVPVDAIRVLTQMKDEKLICHASGDFHKPIIAGFYLYYIVQQDFNLDERKQPLGNLRLFENEWMEVEIVDSLDKVQAAGNGLYKECFLDVDVSNKSDRAEWGHARYHKTMIPGYAFEIAVEWIAASGSIMNDLVYNWNRKAQHCGYQLIPIPHDAIGEELTEKLNPFRSPIFVPINFDGIDGAPSDFTSAEVALLEGIATRFGFLPTVVTPHRNQLFVHCTGMIFIYLPPFHKTYTTILNDKEFCSLRHKLGFLWQFNFLLPNRKLGRLGSLDPDRVLQDFRGFCSNINNRLKLYYQDFLTNKVSK